MPSKHVTNEMYGPSITRQIINNPEELVDDPRVHDHAELMSEQTCVSVVPKHGAKHYDSINTCSTSNSHKRTDPPLVRAYASMTGRNIDVNVDSISAPNVKHSTPSITSNDSINQCINLLKIPPKNVRADMTPEQICVNMDGKMATCELKKHYPDHIDITKMEHNQAVSYLSSNAFWSKYSTERVRGDGLCLLYSIIKSLDSQHGISIDLKNLLNLLRIETCANKHRYLDSITNNSYRILQDEMNQYMLYKRYNSSYLDILPYILANVLKITICIIYQDNFDYRIIPCCEAVKKQTNIVSGIVYVVFDDDHYAPHYDAIVCKSSSFFSPEGDLATVTPPVRNCVSNDVPQSYSNRVNSYCHPEINTRDTIPS